jgi:hypothetical protein
MRTVTIKLTLDQVLAAVEQLSLEQKIMLRDRLNAELNREQVERQFDEALRAIRAANVGFGEDEVLADVNQAVHEVRAERREASGR